MIEKPHCPHCSATMGGRWERITPGLVRILVKFKQAVIYAQKNNVNPNRIASLNHVEKANFQKLRFHALVAKVRDGGVHEQGHWLLTHRGSQFLLGNISVPRAVFVFRNEVRERSQDMVSVGEVLKSGIPEFDGVFDFEYESAPGAEIQGDFFRLDRTS